ncbi:MAG: hypothetical protein JSV36_11105 [Anaerolineae bacterium]|nr:MAG: hypothetical protein JSV36_11105 [Anaerolineae bacterium]
MPKKLNLAIVLSLLVTSLLGGTVMAAQQVAPVQLPTAGPDLMRVAPIGLIIFGFASLGIGVIGYAIARRRSA